MGIPRVKETKVPVKIEKGVQNLVAKHEKQTKIEKGVQDVAAKQEAKVDCKVSRWYPSLGFGDKDLEKHVRLPYTVPCTEAMLYPVFKSFQYAIIFFALFV